MCFNGLLRLQNQGGVLAVEQGSKEKEPFARNYHFSIHLKRARQQRGLQFFVVRKLHQQFFRFVQVPKPQLLLLD